MVGLAVAVAVLGVEDVRGRGDEHPAAPGHHAGGKRQAVQERGCFVVDSITVGVFQEPHDAPGLALAIDSERIIPHLHHPELAVGPPVQRDRVLHQRFARGDLDLEARRHANRAERLLRRHPARQIVLRLGDHASVVRRSRRHNGGQHQQKPEISQHELMPPHGAHPGDVRRCHPAISRCSVSDLLARGQWRRIEERLSEYHR